MTEQEIKKSIMDYLNLRADIYFFRLGSGLIRTEQGRYFKTGARGCPDIVVLKKGRFIGLEVKNDKGKQSEDQQTTENKIKQCGGEYYLVRSIDDVIDALKEN